jgi:anti-sigma regulatory factor (Ser/Thr protein kinase)
MSTIRDMAAFGREIRLDGLPSAPGTARRFVVTALAAWGVSQSTRETVELLVSELVTNAVKQTGRASGPAETFQFEPVALVVLRVRLFGRRVLVEVWDCDPEPPLLQEQVSDAESGRGLFLVSVLAKQWSYYLPQLGGKVVWFEVEATRAEPVAVAAPLPRRVRKAVVEGEAAGGLPPGVDVALVERVIRGLKALRV